MALFEFIGLAAKIYDLMTEVTSADKAYQLLKESGEAVTRARVRDTWREVGNKTAWGRVLETWGLDRNPPKAWQMVGSPGMSTSYQFRYGAWGIDPATGETVKFYVTVVSETSRGADKGYDDAIAELGGYMTDLGIEVKGFEFGGIWRKP